METSLERNVEENPVIKVSLHSNYSSLNTCDLPWKLVKYLAIDVRRLSVHRISSQTWQRPDLLTYFFGVLSLIAVPYVPV